ncbi:MAG: hypothetical protein LUE11_09670 [Clostridia bacterium]|nr:hypothetical protein [Clostridia bacterium]
MGLLSEIHQISKSGSRDQLNTLLYTGSNSARVPNLYTQRDSVSKIRHNAEISLAAIAPVIRTY